MSQYPTKPVHISAQFLPLIQFWAKQRGMSVTQFVNTHLGQVLNDLDSNKSKEVGDE
jgi:hypothetical protein